VAADGSVDKAALLRAIRNVSFDGATGRVHFDPETGERDATDLPLRVRNVQLVSDPDGTESLSLVDAWVWRPENGSRLEPAGDTIPVWPGGERSWELPIEELECKGNSVFSRSSMQCELCPKGTRVEGRDCVRFDAWIGILVPLRWQGPDGPMWEWPMQHAASAAMAAYHINHRVTSLVPGAEELLPLGFKLAYDLQDSRAQPSPAIAHVVKWNQDGVHAVVGALRSAVTGPLALVASIESTPVIAWGSTASTLSDRVTYPLLSRTVLSDALLALSTVQSFVAMNWRRVVVLCVDDAFGR
jgi:ABC-type branched-subunit amino acid transport system substrate-binding protein